MPYRRLPNTDQARINALRMAISMDGIRENGELILSYRTIEEASNFLNKLERAQKIYQSCYNEQCKASKMYRTNLRMARLYVSHFIQVLNMTITRGELKKEIKTKYGLETNNYSNPDLSSETALIEWGEKIIKGEESRISQGGIPIYNPNIAKVKVHFDIYKENYYRQKMLQSNTNKALDDICKMRSTADILILDIWNRVESLYIDLPTEQRMQKCKPFGIVYYYRSSEKAKMKADAMQKDLNF